MSNAATRFIKAREFGQHTRTAHQQITHGLKEAIALGDRVVVRAAGPRSRVIDSFPGDLQCAIGVCRLWVDSGFSTLGVRSSPLGS